MQALAVDRGMWKEDGLAEEGPQSPPLLMDAVTARELDAKVRELEETEAAPAGAAVTRRSRTFKDSQFKALYDGISSKKVDVWEAVATLVTHYKGKKAAERFVKKQEKFVKSQRRKMEAGGEKCDPWHVAMLLWTSPETKGAGEELCSLLNRCLREDGGADGAGRKALEAAARYTRLLNEGVVSSRGSRCIAGRVWPRGPAAAEGRSDEAHATFRGAYLPDQYRRRYAPGARFRTQTYVATSFRRDVAREFMDRAECPAPGLEGGPVLWTVQFPSAGCAHVRYLNRSAVKGEEEFLLAPYSILTVQAVQEGHGDEPHRITVLVASDNKTGDELEELMPWI